MNPNSPATIAVVTSSRFEFDPPHEEVVESAPVGQDFAQFVQRLLVAGSAEALGPVIPGEGGWSFDVARGGTRFRLFVHWAPIGDPPADRWVIQPGVRKSALRSLFGRTTTDEELEPIILELRRVLDDAPEIDQVSWITAQEFARIY